MLMAVLTPGETLSTSRKKEHQLQENDIIASHEEDEKEEHAVMKKTENSDEEEEGDVTLNHRLTTSCLNGSVLLHSGEMISRR